MHSSSLICAISTFYWSSGESAIFLKSYGDGVIVQSNVQHEWDDVVLSVCVVSQ